MTDQESNVVLKMGLALLCIQAAEKVLGTCLALAIRDGGEPLTLEMLALQNERDRRATLGQFLVKLRERVSIDEAFDRALGKFLNDRNSFVHDLERVENWDLGRANPPLHAEAFVDSLINDSIEVTKVFMAVIRVWEKQIGREGPKLMDAALSAEVVSVYMPLVNSLFFEKSCDRK